MEKEVTELTQSMGALSMQKPVQVTTLPQKKIYVLACAWGKFYVGKTEKEVSTRLQEHLAGEGSAWTKLNPVHSVVETLPDAPFLEDAKTLEYMRTHGVDNVRGGKYSQTVLLQTERDEIERSMRHENGTCMQCGATSHFVSQCPSRPSTTLKEPVVRVAVNAKKVVSLGGASKAKSGCCYRCGRDTHWVVDCYARTHLDGTPL